MATDVASSAVHMINGPENMDDLILPPTDLELDVMVIDFSAPERRLRINFCLLVEAEKIRALTCRKYILKVVPTNFHPTQRDKDKKQKPKLKHLLGTQFESKI